MDKYAVSLLQQIFIKIEDISIFTFYFLFNLYSFFLFF